MGIDYVSEQLLNAQMGIIESRDVKIQPLTEEDIPSLMELENEAFPLDCWSEKAMRTEFSENPDGFRIVRSDNRVSAYVQYQVGYARLDLTGSENDGIIASLAVAQRVRRQGLGELLMSAAINNLRELNASRVILHTRASNFEMISLCSKLGFCKIGEEKSYYSGSEDAHVLGLQLS